MLIFSAVAPRTNHEALLELRRVANMTETQNGYSFHDV
jgi:hypothetical protein